jgi:hypothetical protein
LIANLKNVWLKLIYRQPSKVHNWIKIRSVLTLQPIKMLLDKFAVLLFLISKSYSNLLHSKLYPFQENSGLLDAAEEIILSSHEKEFTGVNIVNSMLSSNIHDTQSSINRLLMKVGSKIKYRLVNFNESFLAKIKNRMIFTVMFCDSIDSFRITAQKITSKRFNFSGYYLIIFKTTKTEELHTMFQMLWDMYIFNINILTQKNDSKVEVFTFFPFSEKKCNSTEPSKIAEFVNGSFLDRPKFFFPEKFQNFYNCPIKVTTFESLAPSVLKEDFSNGSYRLYGRDVDIIHTLAEELNFKPDIFYILQYGGWGILFPNGSATGSMGRAIRREADFVLGNIYLKYDRSFFMEYSYTYFLDTLVFVIPQGKLLTSFQKLIQPFTLTVWIFLTMTLVIGFIVIAILQFKSKTERDFVIGRNVKSPSLNLIGALFGLSQNLLPKHNFSRSLLMMFILFCLVLR